MKHTFAEYMQAMVGKVTVFNNGKPVTKLVLHFPNGDIEDYVPPKPDYGPVCSNRLIWGK